ncbi:MAG TPA: Ig-like domain-containing protein [Casimicrobiaceae bacterium]|nr:Ig-like domain-containing protein [Casimicrobiaceae bacterium]
MRCHYASAAALLLMLLAEYAAGQPTAQDGAVLSASRDLDLRYVGASTRLGIGYNTRDKLRGDAYQVFGETEHSAWIGELWLSERSAAGAQLSYHWQPEGGGKDAFVRKVFGAVDQNRWHDRKVTAGGGAETEQWFASGHVSAAITGRRELSAAETATTETITGTDNGRPFEQDIITTTRTTISERAYDYGVGVRAGHFYEGPLIRLQLGFDYEWGRGSAAQSTVSLGVEKFFDGTPHSVALVAEAYHKRGDLEPERNDERLTLMYRYEFGGPAYRLARGYRLAKVETPAAVAPPAPTATPQAPAPAQPRIEKRLVKTTASMASDAFFDFDRATLRDDAKAAIDAVISRLKASGYEGNIRITGHTCDIGSAAYNQKLSERRAQTVRQYLINGGLPAERLLAEGMGLRDPRYPNTREGRPKNRRVDLEFVTYETRTEDVVLPPEPGPAKPAVADATPAPGAPTVEWRREYIDSEPAWLRRALHNPAQHKQAVDVYRLQTQTSSVTQGEKRFLNRPPVAVNDAFTLAGNSAATALDVVANDSDPDGDALTIVSVSAPAHGTASISGNKIAYTPTAGYVGTDSFAYTIADPKGLTSSATVAITITGINHPPIAQPDYAVAKFNTPVTIPVLANDSDPDGDPLTIVSFTSPVYGTVARGPDNTLIYTAFQNFIGMDAFQYTISDGRGGTASTLVTVYADP